MTIAPTSVLEDAFWKGLKEIASERNMTTSELIAAISSERQLGNLSSVIRFFVLASIAIRCPTIKRSRERARRNDQPS